MNVIDDLSIELYSLIFQNLSIQDLFNCRLVNKKFKYATYKNVHKLVINQPNDYDHYWYNNGELINDNDIISLGCLRRIRSLSIFDLDRNLKYLKFNWNNENYKTFKIKFKFNLSNFINLECLIINSVGIESLINIDLKNLKYLKVYSCGRKIKFELNIPKLEKIQFNYINEIKLNSNPKSIKHVTISKYSSHLEIFKNLEILEINPLEQPIGIIDEDLLSIFKNLKQFKIRIDYNKSAFYELIEENLIDIYKSQAKLNRHIDMYLNGVKIINIKKLKEYKSCESSFEFQIHNYDLLDTNLTDTFLQYSYFNNSIDSKNLPPSFFNKFQILSQVLVCRFNETDKLIDSNNLSWFLSNLKYLKRLIIISVPLDQNFFNNLPDTIQIFYIKIYENRDFYLNINFNFILRFKNLLEARFNDFNIDLFDLAPQCFANSKYLKLFKFCFNDQRIEIYREHKYFYLRYLKYRYETISDNVIGRTSDDIMYNKLDYNEFMKKCNKLELNGFDSSN